LEENPLPLTTLLILQQPPTLEVYLLLSLLGRPASVGELAEYLNLSEPAIRRTLKMLSRLQAVRSLGCWRFQAAPAFQPENEFGLQVASMLVEVALKHTARANL
jgi:DNA-binding transcriptional ArsR family regulator